MAQVAFLDSVHEVLWERLTGAGMDCVHAETTTREEVLAGALSACTGIVLRSRLTVDGDLLDALPALQWVARSGAGLEEMTRTLRRSASAMSMLSNPAPLRATHCSAGRASSSSLSTVSRERNTMPVQADSAPASTSSRVVRSECTHSIPAALSRSHNTS